MVVKVFMSGSMEKLAGLCTVHTCVKAQTLANNT